MDWLKQYETTLMNTLQNQDLENARALVQGFHRTQSPPTVQTCYLEAALCYYEGRYPLALFWADQGFLLDPDYFPLQELLTLLTEYDGDFTQYSPTFFHDVSAKKRRLRIIIVEGPIKIVNYTAELFRKDFEALGHEVFIFSMTDMQNDSTPFWDFCKKGLDFCLTFNNLALCQRVGSGEFLWDSLGIPCYDFMFDHPLYFFDTFDAPPSSAVVTCVDRRHVAYVKRFYPKVNSCFFLPLGSQELFIEHTIPWQDRPIQTLYVGSLKKNPHAKEDEFSAKVVDLLCQNTNLTLEEAVEQLLPSADQAALKTTLETYRYCDLNTNSIFREHLVRVLVNAKIHVHVYGAGWDDCDFANNPFFHLHQPVPQVECLHHMANSRFVLNSMPWFKDGTHDRIYNAMLARSLCITDPSAYLQEDFQDQEDILYYSLDQMDRLPELIHYYEAHPDEACRIIENGYQKTVLSHTWQNRAIHLLAHFFASR